MSKYEITDKEIKWTEVKKKFNTLHFHTTTILKHDDHISIHKVHVVNGKQVRDELTHVPLELLDKIKNLKNCE